jgi:hypothetical protein
MRLEFERFGLSIMNMMIVAKRVLFSLLTLSALALYAIAANDKQPCPLPIDTTSADSSSAQSPEKPPCMRIVMHNGMPICLPCPAADAHTRVHGDADLGPCDKPGNIDPGSGH